MICGRKYRFWEEIQLLGGNTGQNNSISDLAVLDPTVVVDWHLLAPLLPHGHLPPPHPVERGLEEALAVVDAHGGDVVVGGVAVQHLHGGLQARQVAAVDGRPAQREIGFTAFYSYTLVRGTVIIMNLRIQIQNLSTCFQSHLVSTLPWSSVNWWMVLALSFCRV